MKKEIIYDLLNFALIFIYFFVSNMNLLQLMHILKLKNLKCIFHKLDEAIQICNKQIIYQLVRFIAKFLFFAHCVACLWIFLGNISSIKGDTWLTSYPSFEEKSIGFYYLISLYWAITLISRTGFGDITPKNEYEYCFCLVVMILSLIFLGYSFHYGRSFLGGFEKGNNENRFFYIH